MITVIASEISGIIASTNAPVTSAVTRRSIAWRRPSTSSETSQIDGHVEQGADEAARRRS